MGIFDIDLSGLGFESGITTGRGLTASITATDAARARESLTYRSILEDLTSAGFPPLPDPAPSPRATVPDPEAKAVSLVELPDADYLKLCRELGIEVAEVREAKLRSFLADNFIECYDGGEVDAYLKRKAIEETGTPYGRWYWRPLRQRDGALRARRIGYTASLANVGSANTNLPYDKPVPYPVLLTVKKLAAFDDTLEFYVSDYEVKRPDPFLMVTGKGLPEFIIERWDEPSYRDKTVAKEKPKA